MFVKNEESEPEIFKITVFKIKYYNVKIMSSMIPASLKSGAHTTNTLILKRYLVLYVILIWLSILPLIILGAMLLEWYQFNYIYLLIAIPVFLVIGYFLLLFTSLFWGKVFLSIVNLIYPPQEGIFPRTPKEKAYRFWSLRAVIKKFPLWVSHIGPIPWADNLAFKLFGNNISYKTAVFDGWVDAEFLEVGKESLIGQGAVIMTSMITIEHLIIRRVKIGKNCLIGAHSVVFPGTTIGNNVVLGALSSTHVGQDLEAGWIYMGNPAQKFKESKFRVKDELTPEERAERQYLKDDTTQIKDSDVLIGRKGAIASFQSYKSKYKKHRAYKHEIKAHKHVEKAKLKEIQSEEAKIKAIEKYEEKQEKEIEKKLKKDSRKKKHNHHTDSSHFE